MIRLTLVLLLCNAGIRGSAQTKDALLWTGFSLKKGLSEKFGLKYESQIRIENNITQLAQYYNEISLKYAFLKNWNVEGIYRYSRKNSGSYFFGENRFCLDVDFSDRLKIGIKPSIRFRLQHAFDRVGVINETILPRNRSALRLKGKISYKNDAFKRIQPYVGVELFSPIFSNQKYWLSGYRFSTGLEFDLPKRHELVAGYLFEQASNSQVRNEHVYLIQYNYTLK